MPFFKAIDMQTPVSVAKLLEDEFGFSVNEAHYIVARLSSGMCVFIKHVDSPNEIITKLDYLGVEHVGHLHS